MKTVLLLLGFLLATTWQAFAANISGRLVDGNNQPIEFANVVLLTLPDSTFQQGTISASDGSFALAASSGANSVLRISCIGYSTLYRNTPASNLGTITLDLDTQLLDEVVIKASLPATRLRNDALVTNVQSGILARAGSASDVLSKIPGIMQKEKNTFEVFGKGAPLIYINGRQIRDLSELESLRSEDIKEVELITNPGAKYDSTVKAVIRIKTIKHQGDGFGFDLRSSYYQWKEADAIEEVKVNYRTNGFDFFGSYRYSIENSIRIGKLTQTTYTDKLWTQDNVITDRTNKAQSHRAEGGLNYQIDENHSVGARYTYQGAPRLEMKSDILSDIRTDGVFYDRLNTDTRYIKEPVSSHRMNAYYSGKIKDLEIDFNADYYSGNDDLYMHIVEESQNYEDRNVGSRNLVDNELLAAKLIFTYPVVGGTLTWGGEYSHTRRNDDFLSENEYVETSYSLIKEGNMSAFAEYSRKIPIGQLSAGVRYEHAAFDYYVSGEHQDDQSRSYGDWFPNASFSTSIGKVQTQLSYTTKTRRPSYKQLSNNVFYANRFTYEMGNPTLKPSFLHDVSLSATWKFLQASVSYQVKKDPIIYWSRLMEDNPGASLLYFENLDKLPGLQALVAASPTVGMWSPSFSVGFMKQWFSVESGGETLKLDQPMWDFSLGNSFDLPRGFLFSVDYNAWSNGNNENMYSALWGHLLNASIRKSFLKEALSVTVGASDILDKKSNKGTAYSPTMRLTIDNRYDSREVYVTVRYRFNSGKDKYKGTGAGGDAMRRL